MANDAQQLRDLIMPGGRPINWHDNSSLNSAVTTPERSQAQELIGQAVNAGNAVRATNSDIRARQGTEMNDTIAPEYVSQQGDRRSASAVAKALREGPLTGVSEQYIREQLEGIVQQGGGRINFAQAGTILERSVVQRETRPVASALGLDNWFRWRTHLGGGREVDPNRISAMVEEVKSGAVLDNAEELSRLQDVQARLQQADALYQRSVYEFQEVQRMAQQGDRRANGLLPQLQARVMERRQMRDMVQAEAGNHAPNTFQREGAPARQNQGSRPGLIRG
jgi:hypothetical protein